MNRNAGMSAGILAILALVFHVSSPTSGERQGTEAVKPATGDSATKAKKPTRQRGQAVCNEPDDCPEGPWQAAQSFFNSAHSIEGTAVKPLNTNLESVSETINCAKDGLCRSDIRTFFGLSSNDNVEFLLATVPDPLHTRLALFTDSSIQAIQRAVGAAGWTFASQWLPWNDPVDSDEKDPSTRREQREAVRRRENKPGILVFRHKPIQGNGNHDFHFEKRVLFVFLVGETPTAGVAPVQFQLARAYMKVLRKKLIEGEKDEQETVRIQGPTFSGSLHSLSELIQAEIKAGGENGGLARYLVRSGTAMSSRDREAFTDAAKLPNSDKLTGAAELRYDYYSASASSTEQFRGYLSAVAALKIPPYKAALLAEDETGFGDAIAGDATNDKIRVFRYPRDISHLRNAYREVVQSAKSDKAPSPDINFSLKDINSGEDSVPVFSTAQTPLSQNAVLQEITRQIRRDGYQIVEVAATNVLDMVFLAQILRRQCPDTRVVISNADLLYAEAARTQALTGMLALSTYPLFDANNKWRGKESPLIHSDANSEGIYNAVLLLLADSSYPEDKVAALGELADYRSQSHMHPPLWLLTFDRAGFLPIRKWEIEPGWFKDGSNGTIVSSLPDPPNWWFAGTRYSCPPDPPQVWWFASGLLALAAMATGALILWLRFDKTCTIGARMDISRVDPNDRWRRVYVVLLLSCFAGVLLVLWLPGGWCVHFEIRRGLNLIIPMGFVTPIAIVLLATADSIRQHDWKVTGGIGGPLGSGRFRWACGVGAALGAVKAAFSFDFGPRN
jgi:hypothetical protein